MQAEMQIHDNQMDVFDLVDVYDSKFFEYSKATYRSKWLPEEFDGDERTYLSI